MNTHRKTKSQSTVSPAIKLVPLNVLRSLEIQNKRPKIRQRSMYAQRKEKIWFKILKSKAEKKQFSETPDKNQGLKERQSKDAWQGISKKQDFHFESLGSRSSNNPKYLYPDFHIGGSPQLHNIKKYRICYNKRSTIPSIDSALMITKKKILPSANNDPQFLSF